MKNITMNKALELCTQAEHMTREERQKLITERLKELVFYAREHSPFFREWYQDIGEEFSLTDLPPVTKSQLMESYESWVTDPEITRESITKYLRSEDSAVKPYLGKYSALTTSGTTSAPMPMVRDSYHNAIHGAMIQTRLLRNVDADIMNPKTHRIATVIFLDPQVSSYSSFLKMERANETYKDNILAVSLEEDPDVIAKKLDAFQPDLLTGYPSVMGVLAKAQRDGKMSLNLQAIACSAELLTAETHQALKEAFGCAILNNYCSTEGGEAAMSCEHGAFHINEDWVIIEPVKQDGTPAEPGEWSDGILITDLTNCVQPVIRYYMEDRAKISHTCDCGSSFPVMELMGRACENITVGGKAVMGVGVVRELEHVPSVYSLQVIQKGDRSFEVRLVAENEEKKQAAFEDVKAKLRRHFGKLNCGRVEITFGEEAPRRSVKGGKVKLLESDL